MTKITPRLIVPSVATAIDFYTRTFGAREQERYTTPQGHVVHAAILIGDSLVTLADAKPAWKLSSPDTFGGSPVLLTIELDDPDSSCARAVAHGATVIIPLADQFYGRREGRLQDPFGHLWILSKVIEDLPKEEIERRMLTFGS